ncbi:uncharacterized protein [Nothobranchius furzeri]|uniref:uncharacterized protein isoform X1 n=1 Tax=Nothobranchius furzeri TaxID=105023 RepID=UPI0039048920
MWPCKLCDRLLSTRYELLKHFRLKHFHHSHTGRYPCAYLDCPCTFTSWKKLLSHTYRIHSKLETGGAQSTTFSCQTCGCEVLSTEKEYFSHINQHLRQYENVTCMFEGCTYQSNIYGTFNSHKNRKHNPHSLTDFKAGVVKVSVQSSPEDEGPTCSADLNSSLSDIYADSDSDITDLPEVVEKKLCSVFLKLENIFHVPSTAIDELVDELHYLLSTVSVSITCSSISDYFKSKNVEVDNLVIKELSDSLCKSNPLANALRKGGPLATAYKRKEYYKEVFKVVEPVEFLLDQKTSRSFQYIPILPSLQQILDSPEVLNRVIDSHRTQGSNTDQLKTHQYRSIRDGLFFKDNPFLSGDELNICLTLYIDDFELCNPLGTSRKKHKLCSIYWILNNLGPGSHSALTSIYLGVLCKSNDVKTYGYKKILEPLLHDLLTLEEHGVYVSKLGTFVKGTVHSVIADNLGAHALAGFIESFSGHYICRFCTAQKEEIQSTDVYSGAFTLRTKEIHEAHLKTAQDTETSCFGVKRACPLTEHLNHFHVNTGYPPDIVHDLFEGIVPFELAVCLNILISKKYFTLEFLNTCILKFPLKWSDKKNRPHLIPHTYSSRKTVGGNAHENWCLIRFLPFLIGDIIPEDELAWQVILDLKEIVELVVAPVHTQETIAYLDVKVSEHRQRLRELVPGETLKPKHHYLEHYPHLITCFGPLVGVWTIRFEAKHSFFKQVARHTNNFRNIALTLATKHQQLISYHLHSSSPSTSHLEVTNVSTVSIDVLNEEVVVALRHKYPDIVQVNLTKNVTSRGINYRNGMMVVCDSTAGMPEFAEILQMCIVGDDLSFIVRLYFAWYQDHFRAFELTLSPDRKVALVQLEELRDCYPLVAYTVGSRHMVTLKRHIVI